MEIAVSLPELKAFYFCNNALFKQKKVDFIDLLPCCWGVNLGNSYGLIEAVNLIDRKPCLTWAETEIFDSGVS